MRLVLLPQVRKDLKGIMAYYERAATDKIAEEFYAEFERLAEEAVGRPHSFSARQSETRRVNFSRFPYHFLFRIESDKVVVTVVRHNKRHPSFGTDR
jgi:plasmid stabilization system protein ParE